MDSGCLGSRKKTKLRVRGFKLHPNSKRLAHGFLKIFFSIHMSDEKRAPGC